MITNEMIDMATKAVAADFRHGTSHGCRVRWGASSDNFNLDGHVDLDQLVRVALTAALQTTTQEKT